MRRGRHLFLWSILWALATLRLGAQPIAFGNPASYGTGADAHHTVAADFNGDGKLDLAVECFAADTVQVYLNAGGGSFTALTAFSGGDGPFWLAAGDFNRDGKTDLALATWWSKDARLYLGSGDGTFTAGGTFAMGDEAAAVVAADFNRDGKLDLAVSVPRQDAVKVALGNGDGTFGGFAAYATGSWPAALTADDVDSDGDLDLAVACEFSDVVTVLRGPGDGTFPAREDWAAGDGPESVLAGDFDRDGWRDLVVSDYGDGKLAFLRGLRSGGFAAPVFVDGVTHGAHLAVADFNSDGFLDVALPDYSAATTALFSGGEGGTFTAQAPLALRGAPATGDFDGDGRVDLAQAALSTLSVSFNTTVLDPSGTFAPARFTPTGTGPGFGAAGDFDRDGIPDVAVTTILEDRVELYRGLGDGTFVPSGLLLNPYAHAVVTADFNRDGKLDLVVANASTAAHGSELSFYRGRGDGTFTGPTFFALADMGEGFEALAQFIVAADFNRDGIEDLLVTHDNASWGGISVLMGVGDGSFLPAIGYWWRGALRRATTGDFDRDGRVDVAVADYGGREIMVFRNWGESWFENFGIYMTLQYPTSVAAGDFDGDGDLDLAATELLGDRVQVLSNNGGGTFTLAAGYFDVSGDPLDVEACDVDRDGRPDLPTCDLSGGRVVLGRNLGGLTFDTTYTCGAGTGPFELLPADYNRDGKVDLAAPDLNGDRLALLLNDTCTVPPTEVRELRLTGSGTTTFSWQAPATPGPTRVRYDLLRSQDPADFTHPSVVARYRALTSAQDDAAPEPLLCYIVRAENGCGSSP